MTTTVPTTTDAGPLRSPEDVLATITAIVRRGGLARPRRICFEDPGPGEPAAVLSLAWTCVADMRPWLQVFCIDPRKRGASTVFGDYEGWSLLLSAPEPVDSLIDAALAKRACKSCGGEMTHQLGCSVALEQIPVAVVDIPHFGEPYGREANADECARLNGGHVDRIPLRIVDVVTVDPDLTADRGNAEVARMVAPQTSFAEALPRLQAQRDDATFAEIVAEVHGV